MKAIRNFIYLFGRFCLWWSICLEWGFCVGTVSILWWICLGVGWLRGSGPSFCLLNLGGCSLLNLVGCSLVGFFFFFFFSFSYYLIWVLLVLKLLSMIVLLHEISPFYLKYIFVLKKNVWNAIWSTIYAK